MATGSKRHTHKYHKIYMNQADRNSRINGIWACALPDCTHFMPLNVAANVEGKSTICWHCGRETVMDIDNMKFDRPFCLECRMGITVQNQETENKPIIDPDWLEKYQQAQMRKRLSEQNPVTEIKTDELDLDVYPGTKKD